MAHKTTVMLSLSDTVRKNPQEYEGVNTGYQDELGREVLGEYLFKGQSAITHCAECGGVLKEKVMRAEKRGRYFHIVNGIARPVEVENGQILVLWVCSRKCTACHKHQRILPQGVKHWMRYALSVVAAVLMALFDECERHLDGSLKGKKSRNFDQLTFYGENATIYRWRRQFAAVADF